MRYDVEVSGFPSSHAGPPLPARLKEDDYPGTTRIEEWPSWDLPVLKWGKSQGGVVGFSHSGWGLKMPKDNAADLRDPAVRRHRRQRVHRRRRPRRGRLHLDGRHPGPLGAEHLVSHAELRLPGQDQRRDRLPLHLRRACRPGAGLRQARRRQARLRPLVRGDQGRPVLRLRRQEPPRSTSGSTTSRLGESASERKLAAPGTVKVTRPGRGLARARARRPRPERSSPAARREALLGARAGPDRRRRGRCPSRSSSTACPSPGRRSRPTGRSRTSRSTCRSTSRAGWRCGSIRRRTPTPSSSSSAASRSGPRGSRPSGA